MNVKRPERLNGTMNKEKILQIILETVSTDHSPYAINGNPPVWAIMTEGENTMFAHPKSVMTRVGFEFQEEPGIAWQWKGPKGWIDQGYSGSFESLLEEMQTAAGRGAVFLEPAAEAPAP